jgi:periplasmic protein TonB
MKFIALFSLSLLFFTMNSVFAQNNTQEAHSTEEIFYIVEQEPTFPGGEEAMMVFIKKNVLYPESAIIGGQEGKVYVSFVVERDGSISNVTIVRGVSPELDNEALRVVKMMPNWIPGIDHARIVRTIVTIPIVFKLG